MLFLLPIVSILVTLHWLTGNFEAFFRFPDNTQDVIWTWLPASEVLVKCIVLYGYFTGSKKAISVGLLTPIVKSVVLVSWMFVANPEYWASIYKDNHIYDDNVKYDSDMLEDVTFEDLLKVLKHFHRLYLIYDNVGIFHFQNSTLPPSWPDVSTVISSAYYAWLMCILTEINPRRILGILKGLLKGFGRAKVRPDKNNIVDLIQCKGLDKFQRIMKKRHGGKIDIYERYENQNTVLHLAAEHDSASIVSWIVQILAKQRFNRGFDDLRNSQGLTPLEVAISQDGLEVVRQMFSTSPILFRNDEIKNAILFALERDCNLKTVDLLYKKLKHSTRPQTPYFDDQIKNFFKWSRTKFSENEDNWQRSKRALVSALKNPEAATNTNSSNNNSSMEASPLSPLKCANCGQVPRVGDHVFGCTENHIVCCKCLADDENNQPDLTSIRVRCKRCKVCSEDFSEKPPRRMYQAERIISART